LWAVAAMQAATFSREANEISTGGAYGSWRRDLRGAIEASEWRCDPRSEMQRLSSKGFFSRSTEMHLRAIPRPRPKSVPLPTAATPEEAHRLAVLLNDKLAQLFPPPATANWFKLFRAIDYDGSGQISYDEFRQMVRNEMVLSRSEVPDKALKQVWRVIDQSGDGLVDAGELASFLRVGPPKPKSLQTSRQSLMLPPVAHRPLPMPKYHAKELPLPRERDNAPWKADPSGSLMMWRPPRLEAWA